MQGLAVFSSLFLFAIFRNVEFEIFSLGFNSYNQTSCLLINFAGIISLVIFHLNKWLDERQRSESLFFFGLGLLGLYVFSLSQDLLTAFVGLELASLSLYLNISMSRKDSLSLEAAIKYFILSALAGCCFLYGLSFLYGSTGTLNLSELFSKRHSQFQSVFLSRLGFCVCRAFCKVRFLSFSVLAS